MQQDQDIDADHALEGLLRKALIKAHLSDEDTETEFARLVAEIKLPDHVYEHPRLKQAVRLPQRVLGLEDATGGVVWNSSTFLVDYLLTAPEAADMIVGRSVLELGAGAGLPSIAAALLGASRVTLTDGDASACETAAANVALNRVEVRVVRLLWGRGSDTEVAALQKSAAASTIVASDVLYDEDSIDRLEETLRAFIGLGVRRVILGWRWRGHGEETFFERLRDLGTARTVRRVTGSEKRDKGVTVFSVHESVFSVHESQGCGSTAPSMRGRAVAALLVTAAAVAVLLAAARASRK